MENQTERTTEVKFIRTYRDLFRTDLRNLVYYGGRYSGKSHHIALALLLRGRETKLRILCTREIQNTIRDSVHKLLKDQINTYGFSEYRVTQDTVINTVTGTEFIFKGLKHNITEIKSMEGIDICWVEEAQRVTKDNLNILTPTIRKKGSQMIFSFNRETELDAVFVEYVLGKPNRTLVRKVNYDVLEYAGFLTEAIRDEMEKDKIDPDLFAHKWLGEPVSQSEGAILDRNSVLQAMERKADGDGQVVVGVDVARMGSDRTAMWKRKGLKTIGTRTYTKKRTTEVCDLVEAFIDEDKTVEVRVDDTGVGGGVTDELERRGYNVVPVNFGASATDKDRYPNWISEAWFNMVELMPEMELPRDDALLMELTTRQWTQDSSGRRKVEGKDRYKKRGYRSPDLADACIICYAVISKKREPNIRWI